MMLILIYKRILICSTELNIDKDRHKKMATLFINVVICSAADVAAVTKSIDKVNALLPSLFLALSLLFIARVERNITLNRQQIVWQRQIRRKFAKMLTISPLYGIPRNDVYDTSSRNCRMNAGELARIFSALEFQM